MTEVSTIGTVGPGRSPGPWSIFEKSKQPKGLFAGTEAI